MDPCRYHRISDAEIGWKGAAGCWNLDADTPQSIADGWRGSSEECWCCFWPFSVHLMATFQAMWFGFFGLILNENRRENGTYGANHSTHGESQRSLIDSRIKTGKVKKMKYPKRPSTVTAALGINIEKKKRGKMKTFWAVFSFQLTPQIESTTRTRLRLKNS